MQHSSTNEVQDIYAKTVATVSDVKLSYAELQTLTAFPLGTLKYAHKSTLGWLQRHKAEGRIMNHSLILKSLLSACQYQTEHSDKKKPSVRSVVRPAPTHDELVNLQEHFYEATAQALSRFTLSESECADLLKRHPMTYLRDKCVALGQWIAAERYELKFPNQDDIVNRLHQLLTR